MVQATKNNLTVGIAVLSKKQQGLRSECRQTSTSRILVQPITLRDLRREIHLAFQSLRSDSSERNAQSADKS
jgi:hypothetical protein